jgi:hypothetical protein
VTELEMKKQSPAKANAIEYFGEDVHGADIIGADDPTQYLDDWDLPAAKSSY